MYRNNETLGTLIILGSIAAIGYAFNLSMKMKKVAEKLDTTVDKISENVEVDISKALVDQAVEKAVNREAKEVVKRAASDAVNKVSKDMHETVKQAVKESYSDVKDAVKDELMKQVNRLDLNDLKREVISSAKERVAEKFDDDLSSILDKYNADLGNISKIYRSIASSFGHGAENAFKIN